MSSECADLEMDRGSRSGDEAAPLLRSTQRTYSSDEDEDLLDLTNVRPSPSGAEVGVETARGQGSFPRGSEKDDRDRDEVCAVFVVSFDTRRGNTLEWCVGNVDLSGVEFKSMSSGSHLVDRDFVYFRKGLLYYGLSCFAKKSVSNPAERGVRMRSVGVMCPSYIGLHRHQAFLERQVLKLLDFEESDLSTGRSKKGSKRG